MPGKAASATPKGTLTAKNIGPDFDFKSIAAAGNATLKYKKGDFSASLAASDQTARSKVRGESREFFLLAWRRHVGLRESARARQAGGDAGTGPAAGAAGLPPAPHRFLPDPRPPAGGAAAGGRASASHRSTVTTTIPIPSYYCSPLFPGLLLQSLKDVVATLDYKVPKGPKGVTVNTKYELGTKKYTLGATWDGKLGGKASTLKGFYTNKDSKFAGEATVSVNKSQKANLVFNQDKVRAGRGGGTACMDMVCVHG